MRPTHWKQHKGDTTAICHTDKRAVSLFTVKHSANQEEVTCQHCKAEMRRQGILPQKSTRRFRV